MGYFQLDAETEQVIAFLRSSAKHIEEGKAVRAGQMEAARIFIARGKLNLRSRMLGFSRTGNLMNGFRAKHKREAMTAYAGFLYGKSPIGSQPSIANHAHLVDLGTVERFTKANVSRGVMPANYFWQDARISEEGKAAQAVYAGIQEAIAKMQQRFDLT